MSEQADEGCQQLKSVKELEGGVSHMLRLNMRRADSSLMRWVSRKGDCTSAITLNTAMALPSVISLP
jgi:hypothetical protein